MKNIKKGETIDTRVKHLLNCFYVVSTLAGQKCINTYELKEVLARQTITTGQS